MCIAIINPSNKTLTKETLNNCWLNNDDGAGFLYVQDGKLKAFKEMKNFDRFFNKYISIKNTCPDSNIVLHFRISTHGVVNKTNCHPFFVNSNLGFVHNGVIHDVEEDDRFSDTYMFNKTILKNLPNSFEQNKTIMTLIAEFIGSGSKLAFLDSSNKYYLVNEEKGHWNDGCWFSNYSYESVSQWVDYGGVRKYRGGYGSAWGYSGYSYNGYGTGLVKDEPKSTASSGSCWQDEMPCTIPSFTDKEIDSATEIILQQDSEVDSTPPKHYKYVDSGHVCQSCGAYAQNGEVFTSDGKCMDCSTTEQDVVIGKEMYEFWDDDINYIDRESMRITTSRGERVIELLEDTYINQYQKCIENEKQDSLPYTPDYNKSDDEVPSRCDFCAKADTENEELKHVEEWNSHLCSSCYLYTGAELMERKNDNNRQWEDDNLAG